jgi:ribonuclease HI
MGLVSVYCDGSSHAKGDLPGGWAFVILLDGEPVVADSGNDPKTTNNVMELTAMLRGLEAVLKRGLHLQGHIIETVSDSQYAGGIASGSMTPSKNIELAVELRKKFLEVGCFQAKWVRGHGNDPWNNRCDSLAHDAKMTLVPAKVKKKKIRKADRAKLIAESKLKP